MAKSTTGISQIINFPEACRENRLPLYEQLYLPLNEQGICTAGISELVAGYDVKRKCPDFFLVIFTFAGKGKFFCDNKICYMNAGTVLIAQPGMRHHYQTEGSIWNMLWFHIQENCGWDFLKESGIILRESVYVLQLRYAMEQIFAESLAEKNDANILNRMYSEMLLIYLRRELTTSGIKDAQSHARFSRLWEQVSSAPSANWTIKKLAREMCMSPSHFSRQCCLFYNISPMRMVARMRLQYVRELLKNTDFKLNIIAEKVGYDNAFSLSAAFKKHIGVSPRQFRNNIH